MDKKIEDLRVKRQKYVASKNWACALRCVDQMIDIEPTAEKYHNRAVLLAQLGQFEQAIKDLEIALTKNSNSKIRKTFSSISNMHRAAIEKNRISTEETIEDIRNTITQEPKPTNTANKNYPTTENSATDKSNDASLMIDKYEIIRKIGEGGMGQVYLAQDLIVSRKIAIKTIREQDHNSQKRFLQEAESLAKLSHPNIISIYSIEEYNNQPFFTMDYIDGYSFTDYVNKNNVNIKKAVMIFEKISRTIDYCHEKGIIHRDLKPENILIRDSDNEPIIVDFGIAIGEEKINTSKTDDFVGTLAYMSPEQICIDKDVDEQTDIYALGIILYQLMTQQLPFTSNNNHSTINKILNSEVIRPTKLNNKISKELENICLKAMAKEKKHRYLSAKELANDLKRFLNDEVVQAMPPSKYYHVKKWISCNPKITKVICVFVILLVTIISYFFYKNSLIFHQTQVILKQTEDNKNKTLQTNDQLIEIISVIGKKQKEIQILLVQIRKEKDEHFALEERLKLYLKVKEIIPKTLKKQKKQLQLLKISLLHMYINLFDKSKNETILLIIIRILQQSFLEHIDIYIPNFLEKTGYTSRVRLAIQEFLQTSIKDIEDKNLQQNICKWMDK